MGSEGEPGEQWPFDKLRSMVGKDRPPGDELGEEPSNGGSPEHEEILSNDDGPGIDDDLGMPGEEGDEVIPEEEREEEEPVSVVDDLPAYMREEEPTKKGDRIKWLLLRGASKEEIVAAGAAPRSVDIAYGELVKTGLLEKKRKVPVETSTKVVVGQEPKNIQVFAKGSPPEALINALAIPVESGMEGPAFEKGLKFGMSVLVLGVRVMQEMSQVGLQQSKPIIDMAKEMRTGEAAAYKEASTDAAMKAAQAMGTTIMPAVQAMQDAAEKMQKPAESGDPMKAMMMRTMEPLMKRMMNQIAPGAENESISNWKSTEE